MARHTRIPRRGARRLLAVVAIGAGIAFATGPPPISQPAMSASAGRATIVVRVVAAENFYADIVKSIGGSHVSVLGIIINPNTDPHSYESSTTDARAVADAGLVVQNGLGYDSFMPKLENASPDAKRTVVDVGAALGYKTGANPHLWYDPATMPRVAALVAADLSRRDPADKSVFAANLRPFALAVQEGNDPSPRDVRTVQNLLAEKRVKVLLYNQQAVEPLTSTLLGLARAHHVPIVGVYETMPASKTYQSWMGAEATALDKALTHGVSTERIS